MALFVGLSAKQVPQTSTLGDLFALYSVTAIQMFALYSANIREGLYFGTSGSF
jgi:hypothetical protein